jgi:hypothetical protein
MCRAPRADNTAAVQAAQEAEQARAREAERQNRITTGRARVNETFGGFNDDFFAGRRKATLDYYTPELTRQFQDARREMEFALARAGLTKSTEAGRQMGLLDERFQVASADVASRAERAAADARRDVETQRSQVLAQLEATGDVDSATSGALARSQTLRSGTVSYDPLGDIFAGVGGAIGAGLQGRRDFRLREEIGRAATPPPAVAAPTGRVVASR